MTSTSPVERHRPSPTSHDDDNSADVANLTHRGSVPASEKRVPLASHRCRTRRGRCTGERPVCRTCAKVGEECTWPSGRRRKRTWKEMEEEERRQKEKEQLSVKDDKILEDLKGPIRNVMSPSFTWVSVMLPAYARRSHAIQGKQWCYGPSMNAANMWDFPMSVPSSSYIWPTPGPSVMSQIPMTPIIPFPQLSGQPEKQTANLARALESQVAYVDGDPTNSDELELYYDRFVGPFFLEIVLALTTTCAQSGSTAIHLGINRISLKLQPKAAGSSASAPVPSFPI